MNRLESEAAELEGFKSLARTGRVVKHPGQMDANELKTELDRLQSSLTGGGVDESTAHSIVLTKWHLAKKEGRNSGPCPRMSQT